jgi:hypothetical protein
MTNQTPCRSSYWCRRTISRKRRRTRLRTTAPPRRPEVMNPARQEFSSEITLKIRSLPRCAMPSRFTRSYSERCVRRRAFGKENEPAVDIWNANFPSPGHPTSRAISQLPREFRTKEVFHRRSAEDSKRTNPATYCAGDSAGVSAGDSVVAAGASVAAGLVSVAGAAVGAGVVAGATVSVFCSHAARSAAPARMQMYFFIIGEAYWFNRSIAASAVFEPAQNVA